MLNVEQIKFSSKPPISLKYVKKLDTKNARSKKVQNDNDVIVKCPVRSNLFYIVW